MGGRCARRPGTRSGPPPADGDFFRIRFVPERPSERPVERAYETLTQSHPRSIPGRRRAWLLSPRSGPARHGGRRLDHHRRRDQLAASTRPARGLRAPAPRRLRLAAWLLDARRTPMDLGRRILGPPPVRMRVAPRALGPGPGRTLAAPARPLGMMDEATRTSPRPDDRPRRDARLRRSPRLERAGDRGGPGGSGDRGDREAARRPSGRDGGRAPPLAGAARIPAADDPRSGVHLPRRRRGRRVRELAPAAGRRPVCLRREGERTRAAEPLARDRGASGLELPAVSSVLRDAARGEPAAALSPSDPHRARRSAAGLVEDPRCRRICPVDRPRREPR